MLDLPTPWDPIPQLLSVLHRLEQYPKDDVVAQSCLKIMRQTIHWRKKNPRPGDVWMM
jgi:hypothetical protein